MTKTEAIEKMVQIELSAVPQEWVQIVAESKGECPRLPMWGTMFFINSLWGEKLYDNARVMLGDKSDLEVEINELGALGEERLKDKLQKAIDEDDWSVLEEYIDEEMAGERCVLDKDGNTTAMFIYEIDDRYLFGVNGAGWSFYHGVWDKLYDLLGLEWHNEE